MRNRHQPGRKTDAPAADSDMPVARIFTPSVLDIDDLAEAIRSLLATASPAQIGSPRGPNPDLLSFPHGVTHVVGENEAL
jgi:hypothetical protein